MPRTNDLILFEVTPGVLRLAYVMNVIVHEGEASVYAVPIETVASVHGPHAALVLVSKIRAIFRPVDTEMQRV